MPLFILRRLLTGALLVWVVVTLTFFTLHALNTDIAQSLIGQSSTAEQIAIREQQLGLDQPAVVQYGDWLLHAVQGDLGNSWTSSEPIAAALAARLPVTLTLAVGATVIATLIGIALGTFAAMRRGWIDTVVQTFVVAGYAFPAFWLALILADVFAIKLRIFPATGFVPFANDPAGWAMSVTLPVIALVLGAAGAIAQQSRNATVQVLRSDYIRTLRSRGATSPRLLGSVLRNAAPVSLTTISLYFIGTLSGTLVVENVFALPGLGQMASQSTTSNNIPGVMGVMTVMVVLVVVTNIALDIAQAIVNPKVRIA